MGTRASVDACILAKIAILPGTHSWWMLFAILFDEIGPPVEDGMRRIVAQVDEKGLVLVLFDEVNGRIRYGIGDQGLAVGCAAFAYAQLNNQQLPTQQQALSPYSGVAYTDDDTAAALNDWQDWIEEADLEDTDVADVVAQAINDGQIVAWFDGRSEFGPRALGNRSILADPRRGEMVERINSAIKKRESYRPFAPSVLEEKVSEWFDDA